MAPRSTHHASCDVVVLGAGPAGTTTAALLARAGFAVEVLEKAHFPRTHIGESLLPCDLKVFDRLDLTLSSETALRKDGAEFYREADGRHAEYPFRDGLVPAIGHAYQVDRARFDADLADLAERAGATVQWGAKVTEAQIDSTGVTVRTDSGDAITARYLVDATGQDAFLGRRARTIRPIYGFGIGAAYAHYGELRSDVREELEARGNIKILILPDGWAWLIPLPGGRLSVGRVSRQQGVSDQLVDDLHATSPVLRRLTEGATRTEAHVVRNFSFQNTRSHGARFACVGDAATFLDPVFSSGVSLGMLGAEATADRLVEGLSSDTEDDPALMTPVAQYMRHAYVTFGSLIQSFYHTQLANHFFFHPDPDPELRAGLISMLAGDVWRDDNRFQRSILTGRRRWDIDGSQSASARAV